MENVQFIIVNLNQKNPVNLNLCDQIFPYCVYSSGESLPYPLAAVRLLLVSEGNSALDAQQIKIDNSKLR